MSERLTNKRLAELIDAIHLGSPMPTTCTAETMLVLLLEIRSLRRKQKLYDELCEDAAQFMYRVGFVAGTPDEDLHGALIAASGKHPMDWKPKSVMTARELMEAPPEVRDRYMREAADTVAEDYEPGGPLHGI